MENKNNNLIDVKKKGTEYYFTCPVCGENGACSYNPIKNKWHDWKCDAGGGPIDLFIALTKDPEKKAVYEGSDGIKAAARDIFISAPNPVAARRITTIANIAAAKKCTLHKKFTADFGDSLSLSTIKYPVSMKKTATPILPPQLIKAPAAWLKGLISGQRA